MSATAPDLDPMWPTLRHLAEELPIGTAFMIVPTVLLYLSIYARVKGFYTTYKILTFSDIALFLATPHITPIRCGPVRCLQNFTIAIGVMKMLDIFARRHAVPKYKSSPRPRDSVFALIIATELRYESFTPNHTHTKEGRDYSEAVQLPIHIGIFIALQMMSQESATILAWEVLVAIYILWTTMERVLRYKDSPPLFGPLYLADSLTGFWSETWHNAFASPCQSLAYNPLRHGLPRWGVPVPIARSLGMVAAFILMAIFHMYAMTPILPRDSLERIGWFFFLNGVGTVVEAAIWGRRKHVVKTVLAWLFETCVATWAAQGARIPHGLDKLPWEGMCK